MADLYKCKYSTVGIPGYETSPHVRDCLVVADSEEEAKQKVREAYKVVNVTIAAGVVWDTTFVF